MNIRILDMGGLERSFVIQALSDPAYPVELARPWEDLLERSSFRHPFFYPLFHEIWLKHLGRSARPKVLLFREKENLVGLAAFCRVEEGGKKGLRLLGHPDVWDYRDLVLAAGREEEVLVHLAGFFREKSWDFLDLPGISEFSPTLRSLPPLLGSLGLQVRPEMEGLSLYVDLPSSWEEYLQGLKSKDRHELRRKIRRLEREAGFETAGMDDPRPLSQRMDIFLALHREREEKARFMTPEMESFFRELACRFQERGWFDLSFLKVAGKEIAGLLSFDFQDRKYIYNSGFDPRFASLSPGIVLAAQGIRRAIERGMRVCNFLRGGEDYKFRLGGREEKVYRLMVRKG
ncbi:MAG: GNAT family N-acetyltransferase [Deltaproteobacteria bacterium]|nr:GNAT family N-acetyltransferase [Deltaproteobacteria bacterium]